MKVIILDPMQTPVVCEIENSLESLQTIVKGYIEITYPFEDNAVIVGNEEAKLLNMRGNIRLNGSIYAGTLIICGDDGQGDLCSLTDKQIAKYTEMFKIREDIPDEEVQSDVGFFIFGW